jgi:transketolase
LEKYFYIFYDTDITSFAVFWTGHFPLLYNISVVMTPSESASSPSSTTGIFSSDERLEDVALRLRRHIVSMIARAGSGHPGGSLSGVEIATSLYFKVLRHKPSDPRWPDRDRFVLSKGHAAPLLYAVLAECGYIPVEELDTLREMGSRLQGHADRTATPGVEMSSGSLGQGLSFATGSALAGRLDSRGYRIYALLGDGECDEGQIWEAAMSAAHYKLDNLTAIIDNNGLQISGCACDVMNIEPLAEKWAAFGWHTIEVDGHDFSQILDALGNAKKTKGKPTAIVAHTVKGKGVSFMENNVDFHGKAPSAEQLEKAMKELT